MSQAHGLVQRVAHCSACNNYLDFREHQVATVCSRCGQGFHVENGHLQRVDVEFSLGITDQSAATVPFWVFTTEMPLELLHMWGTLYPFAGMSIYVPGFSLLLDERLVIGTRLTLWQPEFVMSPLGVLDGCTVTRQDALDMAPFIYMRVLQQLGETSVAGDLHQLSLLSTKIMVLPDRFSQEDLP